MSAGTNRIITPLIVAFVLVTTAPTFAGKIIYFDDDGPADFNNIQAAIDDSNDGDVVIVAEGRYFENINFKGRNITLTSTDPCNPDVVAATIIDGSRNGSVVTFNSGEDGNCVLCGFTITNGHANYGGGIYCCVGSPTISNCEIIGNFTFYGGGIGCWSDSNPTIENCIITGNFCGAYAGPEGEGGGIYCYNSNPTINKCAINSNWCYKFGGGISCRGTSSPMINDCIIRANVVFRHGGGIFSVDNSSPTISSCTIIDNSAGFRRSPGDPRPFNYNNRGGGMYCGGSSPTIMQCTIKENWTDGNGSGICCYSCKLDIISCLISRNSASGYGAGMAFYSGYPEISNSTIAANFSGKGGAIYCTSGSHPKLTNTILWDNSGQEIRLEQNSYLTALYSNIQGGWPGEGNIDVYPLYTSNYHLLTTSPCVNSGDPTYTPAPEDVDIDGDKRVINGRVDMGADELNYEGPIIVISPTMFEFYSLEGSSNPEEQILSIHNKGMGAMNWNVTESCPWLKVYPTNGESTGEIDEVTLSIDISEMESGVYTCELTITADEALNSPRTVGVTLYLYVTGLILVPSEYSTIQSAIDVACDGAVIIVSDGIYTGEGNRDIDFKGKAITVRSENGPENCIIDVNASQSDWHNGFYLHQHEDEESTIDGFTVTGGYTYHGGGIECDSSSPTIKNCMITNNIAGFGGGISLTESNASVSNCLISQNEGWDATGGILCTRSTVNLTNCMVIGNVGAQRGGGISCRVATLTATNCTFAGNSAHIGNFLACIYGNGSRSYVNISNCIIINGGDEIFNMNNSVVTINYSNILNGWPGEGNIDADPCFVDPGYWDSNGTPDDLRDDFWADGDYHLLPTSPCINAGDPSYVSGPNETDLDGNPRVKWGRIDMGAYESIPLAAEVRIVPHTINIANKSNWITAFLWLPEEYNIADLEPNSILLEDKIKPEQFLANVQKQVAIVKFSREQLHESLEAGDLELTINAQLTDSTRFEGTDVIKVINEGGGKLAKYGKAGDPNPADGATDVVTNTDLSWTAGYGAISHDVYFGTSSSPPFVCNQTVATFDPGIMATGTRYYWRIDEVNKWGTTTGDLWSFTTYGPPPTPPPPLPPPPP